MSRRFFADPAALLDAVDNDPPNGLGQSQLIKRGRQIAEELSTETPDKVKATLLALLCRVTIYSDRIEIALSRDRAAELLAGQSIDIAAQHQRSDRASHDVMTLTAPARLKRVGREMRMLVDGSDDQTAADPSLLRIIARAHDVQGRLGQNTKLTVHDIAREERVTAAYLYQPPSAALAGTRHHHGHCQRSPTATTQCQNVDAQGLAIPRRLG